MHCPVLIKIQSRRIKTSQAIQLPASFSCVFFLPLNCFKKPDQHFMRYDNVPFLFVKKNP